VGSLQNKIALTQSLIFSCSSVICEDLNIDCTGKRGKTSLFDSSRLSQVCC
jgi:hypothetical protein